MKPYYILLNKHLFKFSETLNIYRMIEIWTRWSSDLNINAQFHASMHYKWWPTHTQVYNIKSKLLNEAFGRRRTKLMNFGNVYAHTHTNTQYINRLEICELILLLYKHNEWARLMTVKIHSPLIYSARFSFSFAVYAVRWLTVRLLEPLSMFKITLTESVKHFLHL